MPRATACSVPLKTEPQRATDVAKGVSGVISVESRLDIYKYGLTGSRHLSFGWDGLCHTLRGA